MWHGALAPLFVAAPVLAYATSNGKLRSVANQERTLRALFAGMSAGMQQ